MQNAALFLAVLLLTLGVISCSPSAKQESKPPDCPPRSFEAIKAYLQYDPTRGRPLIMAHRGGATAGFPENCIPTFTRTLAQMDCPLLEFDVRMTKDRQLVLLHDDELALDTNGAGLLSETNWADLQALYLKDEEGQLTSFRIPAFKEVLSWFDNRSAILIIDAKPGTDLDLVLEALQHSAVKHQSVLICYSLEDALLVYAKIPDLMLALGFNTERQIETIEQSILPQDQLLALTPRQLQPATYYERIQRMGISCSLGTNGNIDTLPLSSVASQYQARFRGGADIICSDRPVAVAKLFAGGVD